MIKPVIVWVVLAMAAAPSASLLCRIGCDRQAHPTSGCHHQHTLARSQPAMFTASCNEMAMTDAPFVREDVRRRIVPLYNAQPAVAIANRVADCSWQASLPSAERPHHAGRHRPPLTALRI